VKLRIHIPLELVEVALEVHKVQLVEGRHMVQLVVALVVAQVGPLVEFHIHIPLELGVVA